MVNTKKYGDEHFEPQPGGQSVRPSAGPIHRDAKHVKEGTSKGDMINMWKSLLSQDPDAVGQQIYLDRRNELRTKLEEVGVDVTKL